MLQRTIRTYPSLPSLPSRGPLPPMVGVVLPLARDNLVANPSIELATTGYTNTGNAIVRTATFQYHGTYSLQVEPTGTPNTGAYYTIALTAGTNYAISCKMLCGEPTTATTVPGKEMRLWVGDTSGNTLANTTLYSTGRWQWPQLIYHERVGATRRIYFTSGTAPFGGNSLFVDGVQCEPITDGILQATTYIDGDQLGLLPGQQPPPYGWNGTPHASTSYRLATTRAGGYVLNLREAYGFILTGLIGLGMAAPNNVSIPYSVLDGARYLRTTKPPRTLALPGRFWADTIDEQMRNQSAMRAAFDRDAVPVQQPLLLSIEPQDECGNTIGDFAFAQCLYAGGLEGNESNYPAEDAAPTFTMYVPFLIGGSAGAALGVQESVTNANFILQRSAGGDWDNLGTGTNAVVTALAYGLDGTLYAAGSFTDAGGSGADYIAQWGGSAWAVVGSATSLGAPPFAFAVGADGTLYMTGSFVNADGIANADRIASWNGSAYSALSTGLNSGGTSLTIGSDGSLYVGGAFTTAGGVAAAKIAKWNGSAFSALGAGISGGGAQVNALATGLDGSIYVAGDFTTAGATAAAKIAKWNPATSTWSALGTGLTGGIPYALAIGPDGTLYATGAFTTAGGVSAPGIARWNGTGWSGLGTGLGGTATGYALHFDGNGILYVGGDFTTAGGLAVADRAARWNGSVWLPLDVNLPGSAIVYAVATRLDGSFTLGFSTSGTAVASTVTTIDQSRQSYVYPVMTIKGPSSGSSVIYQIVNLTTGAAIYLNGLTLVAGETATFNTDPQQTSFMSNVQGDLTRYIAPGSNSARFYLAPGDNVISFFAASSSVTAVVNWQKRYNGAADLVSP